MTTAPTFIHQQHSRFLFSQCDRPWKRFCFYSLPISCALRERGEASCVRERFVCLRVCVGEQYSHTCALPSASRVPNNDTCPSCQALLWCGICSLTGGWDVTFSFKASLLLGHSSAYAASLWHPLVSLHQGIIRLRAARMCTSCEKVSVQSGVFDFSLSLSLMRCKWIFTHDEKQKSRAIAAKDKSFYCIS